MRWAKITLRTTAQAAAGMLDMLCELAGGAEDLGSDRRVVVLRAHVPARMAPRVVRALRARRDALLRAGVNVKGTRCDCRLVSGQAWEKSWRKGWGVQRLEGGIVIVPSWVRNAAAAEGKAVVLDPGMAFGTGQHATTRLCANALAGVVRRGMGVADVGCGSGILALAAARLGARRVCAIDNDPVAVAAARRNVRRNRLGGRVIVREGNLLDGVRAKFDVIAANIGPVEVARLAPIAARHLRDGGFFIGSGIPRIGLPNARRAMKDAGLRVASVMREGDWVALISCVGQGLVPCRAFASTRKGLPYTRTSRGEARG